MKDLHKFYIGGQWLDPECQQHLEVINPATAEAFTSVALGDAADVDRAVQAARRAFAEYSQSRIEERSALLAQIIECYNDYREELASAVSLEMGAPISLARKAHVPAALAHFQVALEVLKSYSFEHQSGSTTILKEPAGVCALITPWNWPLNQITCKVAPALAAGCTMVLKPSEIAAVSAQVLTKVMAEAGVPNGVFNLIHGDGAGVGAPLAAHPDVDVVSFTGSTRAGVEVSKAAASTVKRVALELGGKSANIVLDDADLAKAVKRCVRSVMTNSGQSCNAPTRLLVPRSKQEQAVEVARATAATIVVGDPADERTIMGPVASRSQRDKVQGLILKGIEEGARMVFGTEDAQPDLPGYFVAPTVFADVTNQMTIAREEIFGPVLCILPYDDEQEAIAIANDSPYGLSGYVWGPKEQALRVARQLRTGNVHLNGAPEDFHAPFGGYKQSGNGREWGAQGFEEFLEVKAIMGSS
ncbi:aldehyde dehydrogenase family protein [Pseudomaricurvus alkylphenolicus]|uniref:aldehyde dehydrogenase family protein n=1 Tax=Pseudomaricurvus alkylphenolicus TaxID=1306991 RepID=UPI0014246C28|nr:aldehyde dehydrogenase family protein [Pseudomaricurvus alkylphenolicus]NIB44696.1 aldehyde dehydrogenase family protein [Pseudomaricurvus alkylphenolicus]